MQAATIWQFYATPAGIEGKEWDYITVQPFPGPSKYLWSPTTYTDSRESTIAKVNKLHKRAFMPKLLVYNSRYILSINKTQKNNKKQASTSATQKERAFTIVRVGIIYAKTCTGLDWKKKKKNVTKSNEFIDGGNLPGQKGVPEFTTRWNTIQGKEKESASIMKKENIIIL